MDAALRNPYDLGDATSFPDKARQMIVDYHNAAEVERAGWAENQVTTAEVYTIWFAKTLQNWKAIVSTTVPNSTIYEVTHDGDKHQTYIDVYVKKENLVIPD